MKKILKYAFRLFKRLDVSPLDCSNLSFKVAIFLVWGINVIFFVTKDLVFAEIDSSPLGKYKTSTLIVKFSPLAISNEVKFEFYIPLNSGVISSYHVNLIEYEFHKIDRERSPPYIPV